MAVSFSRSWGDEIADITDSEEYQTCEIQIVDPSAIEGGVYDIDTNSYSAVTDEGVVYEGRARFIPIRFSVFQEAGAQGNTASLKAGRVQIPVKERGLEVNTGFQVLFTSTPFNGALARRIAIVTDDFQGSTTASRTFSVSMDADAVVSEEDPTPDPDPDPTPDPDPDPTPDPDPEVEG